ncbi:MAG: LysR substrate-binding domain-containing protein [Alphaproteobacteria bacterium]|nr:LysR substrate-binding domain-containing protein [Alphaproteobacteria bacterium]
MTVKEDGIPSSLAGLSLRDLEYIVAVADHRHFGRAAEACGVSQPALSSQIRKLEGYLGIDLFERATRRVHVTTRGDAVITQARITINEARKVLEISRSRDLIFAGSFRLGAITTLGPYLLPHVLRPLRDLYRDVQFLLREDLTARLVDSVRKGTLDAALMASPIDADDLRHAVVFFEPFLVMHPIGHRYESMDRVTADDLTSDDAVLLEDGHCLRNQALSLCGAGGFGVRPYAPSLESLRHLVGAGLGYSLMPALAADGASTLGGLIGYRRFAESPPGRTIGLYWRRSAPDGAPFEALVEFFREHRPAATEPAP